LGFLVDAATCRGRSAFEKVCAVVHGCDKGDAGFGEWVGVAKERDDGRFAAGVLFLLAVGGLLLVFVIVVIVVIVEDCTGVKIDGLEGSR